MDGGRTSGMRKRHLWLILAALVIAAAGIALMLTRRPPSTPVDETSVIITVDGREYVRVPLSRPQTVTIRQTNGAENVVEVTERGALMRSSTCDNQLCVHMGEVTVDNWEWRVNGAFIICLPNRVSVELAVNE